MKKETFGLFVIIIACLGRVTGQDRDHQEWSLGIMALGGKLTSIDKSFSSLPYSGSVMGGGIRVAYLNGNVQHELDALIVAGRPKAEGYGNNMVEEVYGTADYTNLYQIAKPPGSSFNYSLGGAVNFLYGKRNYDDFINRYRSFEFSTSLSAAIELTYFFKGVRFSNRLMLPLLSVLVQPTFGSEKEENTRNTRAVAVPDFLRIKNRFGLSKEISRNHQFSIDYSWDYYRVEDPLPVKQASHLMSLAYSFGL